MVAKFKLVAKTLSMVDYLFTRKNLIQIEEYLGDYNALLSILCRLISNFRKMIKKNIALPLEEIRANYDQFLLVLYAICQIGLIRKEGLRLFTLLK